MKKAFLLTAIALTLAAAPVQAAEWKAGLGPEKPYEGVPEVDLTENMGYVMTYPRDKMPAEHFCDSLDMYLPREDIGRGSGELHVFDENGEIYSCSAEDTDAYIIRPLNDEELEGLMWGGGTCVSIKLPVSLDFGKSYYVHMDEGVFTAGNGTLKNLPMRGNGDWTPVLQGDFGIANLSYRRVDPNAKPTEEAKEETEEEENFDPNAIQEAVEVNPGSVATVVNTDGSTAASGSSDTSDMFASLTAASNGVSGSSTSGSAASAGTAQAAASSSTEAEEVDADSIGTPTLKPLKNDKLVFDIKIGGEVVKAVPYSENGSVQFGQMEYTSSQTVVADITGNEVSWGIVFLNRDGDVLDVLQATF